MTYIFDNDITPKHAEVLRMYKVDVRTVRLEFGPDAKDEDFIPLVGQRGWVLISGDKHMRTKPAEAMALKAASVTALFFGPFWQRLGFKEQAAWLLRHWDRIDAQVKDLSPGSSAKVQQNSKVVPYPE